MSRNSLLISVASIAVVSVCTPAIAGDRKITPHSGEIDPFRGEIDPFTGEIDPFRGEIDPFAGEINPFHGEINPFYGEISPFWGEIEPFWGEINPFSGDERFWGDFSPFSGEINPWTGEINPFTNGAQSISEYWVTVGPAWGELFTLWTSDSANYDEVRSRLMDLLDLSEGTWGKAIQQSTSKSFMDGFASAILTDYGIDLNDTNTLANLTEAELSQFFLDWYDGLMAFSGADIVDHWMATVNWTPAITQDQGEGHDAIIGLLDASIDATEDSISYLTSIGGYTDFHSTHGAAVASLIAARHDGQGVMGIAPSAQVLSYNPFDASGTTNAADVQAGIEALATSGANVINMSLGYEGFVLHQDIANIFAGDSLDSFRDKIVFVLAAGNEGTVQSQNVNWNTSAGFAVSMLPVSDDDDEEDNLKSVQVSDAIASMILVGSVDPSGNISNFSNTPGDACIIFNGTCSEQNKLMYRFIVAPGELLLAADNNGGTTRVSGTSFAAPLVTGAISLLHDRWPWLQNYAEESAQILFSTAQDLGAPGVDPIYGHGLLDVEASQSPINFDQLFLYENDSDDDELDLERISNSDLKAALLTEGNLDLYETEGYGIFAFETVGTTRRDFLIPLSSLLHGQTDDFLAQSQKYQRHIYERMVEWAKEPNSGSISTLSQTSAKGYTMSVSLAPVNRFSPKAYRELGFSTLASLQSKEGAHALKFGYGLGIQSLNGPLTNSSVNYDPSTSGHNPVFGLASGGMFGGLESKISEKATLSLNYSQVEDLHQSVDQTTGEMFDLIPELDPYQAQALTIGINHTLTDRITLGTNLTYLKETHGLLGSKSGGALSYREPAETRALSMEARYSLSQKFDIAVSATAGTTTMDPSNGSLVSVSESGLTTTAAALSLTGASLVKSKDRLQLTFSQPMHVEQGAIDYNAVGIVDRTTGELGEFTERWDLGGGERRFVGEATYTMPFKHGLNEVEFFARADTGDTDRLGDYDAYATGIKLNLKF